MLISLINLTRGVIGDSSLQEAIRAINRQVAEDFEPYWSFGGSCDWKAAPASARIRKAARKCAVLDSLRDQLRRIEGLTKDIEGIEKQLALWKKEDRVARTLMEIPGVGLLTATAVSATIGDAKHFRSEREFAAFLGLVPRQSGTGGRVKMLGISKRGDVYLRTLLIHGARTVATRSKVRSPWLDQLLARRPLNAAVVAQANKMARTIWALVAHERTYQKDYAATMTA